MAASPRFKVYDLNEEYIASFKYIEDAAILVAAYLDGTTIRDGHKRKDIVWTEGLDGNAATSYSKVATVVQERLVGRRLLP